MLEWWVELPAYANDAIIICGGVVGMGLYAWVASHFEK